MQTSPPGMKIHLLSKLRSIFVEHDTKTIFPALIVTSVVESKITSFFASVNLFTLVQHNIHFILYV